MKAQAIKEIHYSWHLKILSNVTRLKACAILKKIRNVTCTVNPWLFSHPFDYLRLHLIKFSCSYRTIANTLFPWGSGLEVNPSLNKFGTYPLDSWHTGKTLFPSKGLVIGVCTWQFFGSPDRWSVRNGKWLLRTPENAVAVIFSRSIPQPCWAPVFLPCMRLFRCSIHKCLALCGSCMTDKFGRVHSAMNIPGC